MPVDIQNKLQWFWWYKHTSCAAEIEEGFIEFVCGIYSFMKQFFVRRRQILVGWKRAKKFFARLAQKVNECKKGAFFGQAVSSYFFFKSCWKFKNLFFFCVAKHILWPKLCRAFSNSFTLKFGPRCFLIFCRWLQMIFVHYVLWLLLIRWRDKQARPSLGRRQFSKNSSREFPVSVQFNFFGLPFLSGMIRLWSSSPWRNGMYCSFILLSKSSQYSGLLLKPSAFFLLTRSRCWSSWRQWFSLVVQLSLTPMSID